MVHCYSSLNSQRQVLSHDVCSYQTKIIFRWEAGQGASKLAFTFRSPDKEWLQRDSSFAGFHVLASITFSYLRPLVYLTLKKQFYFCHSLVLKIWSVGFTATPIKILMTFFIEIEKSIIKFAWKRKILNSKVILSKKNKAESITLPDLNLYNKAIVIRTVWYWHKIDI